MSDQYNHSTYLTDDNKSNYSPPSKNTQINLFHDAMEFAIKQSVKEINYSHASAFKPHITMDDAEKLLINDYIDYRDYAGRYLPAVIINKIGTNLLIHYEGWNDKWDVWSDYRYELCRFAKYKSISTRPAHRMKHLKKDDYIYVNMCSWVLGKIRKMDKHSGQIQVSYFENNGYHLYWVHIDNPLEVKQCSFSDNNNVHNKKSDYNNIFWEWKDKYQECHVYDMDTTIKLENIQIGGSFMYKSMFKITKLNHNTAVQTFSSNKVVVKRYQIPMNSIKRI